MADLSTLAADAEPPAPTLVRANQINLGDVFAFTGNVTAKQINGEIWYDGVTYTTVQAAMTAANAAGSGIVRVGCGTFTGPTTFYSSVTLMSVCPTKYVFPGANGQTVPPAVGTILQYSSNLSLSNISNSKVDGFVFDFQNSGGGIIFGNAYSVNQWPNAAVVRCGNATQDCISWNVTSTGAANNAALNTFGSLWINPNQTGTSVQANCMSMTGVGPVNAGGFVTDNHFMEFFCQGGIRNGLIFRINTDTNYFTHVAFSNLGSALANTACLVFNDVTPNTDQDADGGIIDRVFCSGFTGLIRAGVTAGWLLNSILVSSSGFPSFVNLGTGNPVFGRIQTMILGPSILSDDIIQGRISASNVAGAGPAAGSVAGDITAARLSNIGVYYFGNDSTQMHRDSTGWSLSTVTGTISQLAIKESDQPCSVVGASNEVLCADPTSHAFKSSYNNGTFFPMPQVIASGTSAMTSGTIAAATCQTAVTTTATNTATTDSVEWAYATAPTLTTDALLLISLYVTSGNVNWIRCNPTASSITGTAIVINWRVIR